MSMTDPLFKYFGAIRYVQSKNLNHNYLTERDNIFYVFYIAGFKHMMDYSCGDLLRTNIHILSKTDHNKLREDFFKAYDILLQIDKELLFTDHLSTSDKLSLDFACDTVDTHTYNFD